MRYLLAILAITFLTYSALGQDVLGNGPLAFIGLKTICIVADVDDPLGNTSEARIVRDLNLIARNASLPIPTRDCEGAQGLVAVRVHLATATVRDVEVIYGTCRMELFKVDRPTSIIWQKYTILLYTAETDYATLIRNRMKDYMDQLIRDYFEAHPR